MNDGRLRDQVFNASAATKVVVSTTGGTGGYGIAKENGDGSNGGNRVRPHMVPAGLAAAACAVAVLVIQLRGTDDGGAPLAADELPATAVERADMGEPGPTPDRQVGPRAPAVDATAELAAEAERVEARFRTTAADLLPLARAEHRGAGLRRFDREVAALEAAVVRAPAGKARDRAWHTLLGFLERAALGEPGQRVAVNP